MANASTATMVFILWNNLTALCSGGGGERLQKLTIQAKGMPAVDSPMTLWSYRGRAALNPCNEPEYPVVSNSKEP